MVEASALQYSAMVYIDGENDDDPIELTARIVPRDPEDYAYNYAYGREILLSAVIHLHGSSRSQDTESIELLERQLLFFRFHGFPNL
jgi:hypothetical protein